MHESELVYAILMGLLLEAWYYRTKIRRIKKRTLVALLNDEKYEWRTLKVLQSAIANDRKTTEELLLQIWRKRSTGGQDLWSLKK